MTDQNQSSNTHSWKIRDADPNDAADLIQMISKLANYHGDVASLTAGVLARDAFGASPWIHILVAERNEQLIGYSALYGLIRLQFGQRGLDMHHLFTEDIYRGQGVGRSLVEASKTKARALSCSFLAVGTHPENHLAQAFYEGLGFKRGDGDPPRFFLKLEA